MTRLDRKIQAPTNTYFARLEKSVGRHCFIATLCATTFGVTAVAQEYVFQTIDYPGATDTYFQDVNNLGEIVGYYENETNGAPFVWQEGQFTVPDMSSVEDAEFTGLNDLGTITGFGLDSNVFAGVGFTLQAGQTETFLYPGALATLPLSITNDGTVTGSFFSDFTGEVTGVFQKRGSTLTEVPTPGFSDILIAFSNDLGTIAGFGLGGDDVAESFVIRAGVIETFQHPDGETELYALNNAGTLVGAVYDTNQTYRSFVFAQGTFMNVAFPGAEDTEVWGINDSGVLVGNYFLPGSNDSRAFIATPVPEPCSLVILWSCAVLGFRRWHASAERLCKNHL